MSYFRIGIGTTDEKYEDFTEYQIDQLLLYSTNSILQILSRCNYCLIWIFLSDV